VLYVVVVDQELEYELVVNRLDDHVLDVVESVDMVVLVVEVVVETLVDVFVNILKVSFSGIPLPTLCPYGFEYPLTSTIPTTPKARCNFDTIASLSSQNVQLPHDITNDKASDRIRLNRIGAFSDACFQQ
jgi:hypothetical protein